MSLLRLSALIKFSTGFANLNCLTTSSIFFPYLKSFKMSLDVLFSVCVFNEFDQFNSQELEKYTFS